MLIFVSDRFLLSSNLIEMEIEIEIGTETTSLLSKFRITICIPMDLTTSKRDV